MSSIRFCVAALIVASLPAWAESADSLNQRVRVLERKIENQQEEVDKKAREAPIVTAGEKGFGFKLPDGSFEFRLRGLLQSDARFFIGDSKTFNDGFILRRVEPTFELTFAKFIFFRLQPQFASDSSGNIGTADVYGELRFLPEFNVRAGKFKAPITLENLQSTAATPFIERGLPTELSANRDLGIQIQGALFNGTSNYALGIFNGAPDGRDANFTDVDNRKELAARLFFEPFKNDYGFLRGFGFGVGGSSGNTLTTSVANINNTLPRYRTPGQNPFFNYVNTGVLATSVLADGEHYRASPQAYYYNGSFGLLTEYIATTQQVLLGAVRQRFTHEAWQVATTYLLTGEDASYSGPSKPRAPFTIGGDGWGTLEIAGRYGAILIDGNAFTGNTFASIAASARRASTVGFALNWHLNSNVKLGFGYDWTRFVGGAAAGDRPDERAAFTRWQISF
ncbi:MAG: porin [Pseudomonadota bacterium]